MSEKLKCLEYEMRNVKFEEEQQEQQLEFIYKDETEESVEYVNNYGYN